MGQRAQEARSASAAGKNHQVTSRSSPVIGSAIFSHDGTEFNLDANYGADGEKIRAQINV
ncbi:hypothetical protein EAG_10135 [Camponotus floridanus]|uniref:Uncharacterized protein n=1 Tax=Camponotus floridanus TaxID=104421 RepID=E2AS23_CAMFO|nr:hypothetical protein EAG_10135 [Camponotus floridanus]